MHGHLLHWQPHPLHRVDAQQRVGRQDHRDVLGERHPRSAGDAVRVRQLQGGGPLRRARLAGAGCPRASLLLGEPLLPGRRDTGVGQDVPGGDGFGGHRRVDDPLKVAPQQRAQGRVRLDRLQQRVRGPARGGRQRGQRQRHRQRALQSDARIHAVDHKRGRNGHRRDDHDYHAQDLPAPPLLWHPRADLPRSRVCALLVLCHLRASLLAVVRLFRYARGAGRRGRL
mmetsp:Transcript_39405/g.128101  ORF Transcript_39405/g.128101 Transcript_39405/m.128101 type:complete len:227 (-) Transcript_39405:200-880(-)